jgi:protein-disulfide isomerase
MSHLRRKTFIAAALSLGVGAALVLGFTAAPMAAAPEKAPEFSDAQKGAIEEIVKTYLLSHPDILRDMASELERKQKAEEDVQRRGAIADNRQELFNSSFQAVIGNPKGKTTLVEFFDYNCGYCKRALGDLANLMKGNPDLRVVLKDFPVLGPDSVDAAQVASAARLQISGDKFWEFHQKLLSARGHVGREQALLVAREFGLDMDKLQKDSKDPSIKDKLASILKLGDTLSISGTPSYVVGDEVVVGAVGFDELKKKLDAVGKCGKTEC